MNHEQLADVYEALEKMRDARQFLATVPKWLHKPFMAILGKTKDLDQTKAAIKYLMKMEEQLDAQPTKNRKSA